MAWYHRAWNALRPNRSDRELDRELQFHIAERVDDLVAGGMKSVDAEHEARRRFGNRTIQLERAHVINSVFSFETLIADFRYAWRGLRASRAFSTVAILSLALGIGANTAIFSLVNALLLKTLPVHQPESLLKVAMLEGSSGPAEHLSLGNDALTNPLWEQIRDQIKPVATGFATASSTFNLANGGETRRANGAWVTGEYFNVLGVRIVAGRPINATDDVRGCTGALVLSEGFAEREFGSASAAIGKTLTLARRVMPVIGVVDRNFFGVEVGRNNDLYVPLCAQELIFNRGVLDARSRWYLNIVLRPLNGFTEAQAKARLSATARQIFESTVPPNFSTSEQENYRKSQLTAGNAGTGFSDMRDQYQPALIAMMVLVGVVLLIACANIANLMLARASARQRDVAIRLAIGASRWRIVRQSLAESLLLSFIGAALGILFAKWASRIIVRFLSPADRPVWFDLSIDAHVLGFTVGVATVTAVLFGLIPAWRATQVDAQAMLKSGGRGTINTDSRQRVAKALVIGQVALSLALVATSGLMLGSFQKLLTLDPGFKRDGVLIVSATLRNLGYKDEQYAPIKRDLLNRLREINDVTSASASVLTPIGNMTWNNIVAVPGYSPTQAMDSVAFMNQVSEGFFETMGTPIVAGRAISAEDIAQSRRVAVINETMAKKFFNGANPIGRTLSVPEDSARPREVIGVSHDAKLSSLQETTKPMLYMPSEQGDIPSADVVFALRTTASPASIMPSVRSTIASVNRAIPITMRTFTQQVDASLTRPRLLAILSGFFGALALLVATLGLYGTMSYNVSRRRNEIGIRMALGAAQTQVMRMVVREAGVLIVLGIAIGTAFAFASTRFVSSLLYGLTPTDPATFAMAAALLGSVAVLAACLPALRASRLDPMDALREE